MAPLVLLGTLIDAPTRFELRIRRNHLIFINKDGEIVGIEDISQDVDSKEKLDTHVKSFISKYSNNNNNGIQPQFLKLGKSQFIIPGFIDTHVHAPQYPFTGTATDLPLMKWLDTYTFPTEAKFASLEYAEKSYKRTVNRLINNGTTTVLYYATIHPEATMKLADICKDIGQRAFIGKVSMDQNSPENYVETTEQAIIDAEKVISYINSLYDEEKDRLIHPVITPRFIPTCSKQLLEGLSTLNKKYNVHIQTHASETPDMVKFVESLYPNKPLHRCTNILDSYGLLTDKTVLAHGVYLRDGEVEKLVERGTSVASCPLSNILLSRGVLPLERFHQKGLKIGLGTDIAGGWDTSILSAIRYAVIAARTEDFIPFNNRGLSEDTPNSIEEEPRNDYVISNNGPIINHVYGFHVATVGGAKALGIDNVVGTIDIGKKFDALLVDTDISGNEGGQLELFEEKENVNLLFEKFINLGDDRNIRYVWVNGKLLKNKSL